MPSRDELLRDKTHKGETDSLDKRVFYTLQDLNGPPANLQTSRNTKAIALLFSHLHQQGVLSDDAIDDILLETVSG